MPSDEWLADKRVPLAGPRPPDMQGPVFLGGKIVGSAPSHSNALGWQGWGNGALALTVTKQRSDTRLLIRYGMSAYSTGGGNGWQHRVETGGTGYNVMNRFFNPANQHMEWTGQALISGLAAGSRTLTVQTGPATGNVTTDANDSGWMEVWEVPAV